MDEARRVREFWFGKLPGELARRRSTNAVQLWFPDEESAGYGTAATRRSRTQFGSLVERATRGELASWADSPRRRLEPHHPARSVSAQDLSRHARARLRTTSRRWRLTLSGMQSAADGALDLGRAHLLLYAAAALRVARSAGRIGRGLSAPAAEAPQELRGCFEDALKVRRGSIASIIERFGRFPHRNRAARTRARRREEAWLSGRAPKLRTGAEGRHG